MPLYSYLHLVYSKRLAHSMHLRIPIIGLLLAVFFTASAQTLPAAADYAAEVDPLIGTDYTGNTYPGAQAPFGMVQLSPDNGLPGWDRIAGYFYPDSTIAGFSHTHLSGTGAGDLYDISFMPVTLPACTAPLPLGVHSRFSHANEAARAGYYRVRLADYDIFVELTATPRCGIQRYTFPENGKPREVILNLAKATNWDGTLDSYVRQIDAYTIEGYRYSDGWARDQRVWFRTRFSQPIASVKLDTAALRQGGKGYIAHLGFAAKGDAQLTVITALSPTGWEGAARNLQAEAPTDNFDFYAAEARTAWNRELGRIEIEGGTREQRTVFYTALYHALIAPTLFEDVDGSYRGADHQIHQAKGWHNYETCSLWDTYRAAHPLYALLMPKRASDMINALMAFAEQQGRLPVWNMWASETDMMIGYHAASVIAEGVLKLLPGIDARRALNLCVQTANLDNYRGIGLYRKLGYVPYDVKEPTLNDDWSLSRTLEYAYDDACIARLAAHVGDTETARIFAQRALNYRNVFNPAIGFMQPRDSHGSFQPDFTPDAYTSHICESNGWHYLWSVQHDVPGLIKLMGGKQRFIERLDSMFTYVPAANAELPLFSTGMIGQYAQGNEPSHHVAYLYNWVGRNDRTRHYVHRILNELYHATPAGLCGNEDCGQMSAWYVFSALGFYPLDPTSCTYEVGFPLFDKATLHLTTPNGGAPRKVVITRDRKNMYINGRKVKGTNIKHADLLK